MGSNHRFLYTPELCTCHYQGFTTRELSYLCYWYGKVPSREIALALGRTQKSVQNKAARLRKNGQYEKYQQMYQG